MSEPGITLDKGIANALGARLHNADKLDFRLVNKACRTMSFSPSRQERIQFIKDFLEGAKQDGTPLYVVKDEKVKIVKVKVKVQGEMFLHFAFRFTWKGDDGDENTVGSFSLEYLSVVIFKGDDEYDLVYAIQDGLEHNLPQDLDFAYDVFKYVSWAIHGILCEHNCGKKLVVISDESHLIRIDKAQAKVFLENMFLGLVISFSNAREQPQEVEEPPQEVLDLKEHYRDMVGVRNATQIQQEIYYRYVGSKMVTANIESIKLLSASGNRHVILMKKKDVSYMIEIMKNVVNKAMALGASSFIYVFRDRQWMMCSGGDPDEVMVRMFTLFVQGVSKLQYLMMHDPRFVKQPGLEKLVVPGAIVKRLYSSSIVEALKQDRPKKESMGVAKTVCKFMLRGTGEFMGGGNSSHKLIKTTEKIWLRGKSKPYTVYKNARGTNFIRVGGQYKRLSTFTQRLSQAPQQ
mgnify:CR=1 FL=1